VVWVVYRLERQGGDLVGDFRSLEVARAAVPDVVDWQTVDTTFQWNGWLPDAEPGSQPDYVITLDVVTADDPACREVLCKTIELFDAKVAAGDVRPLVNCGEVAEALDRQYRAVAEWLRINGQARYIEHQRNGDDSMSEVLGVHDSGRALCV
jgi:hypothetical protein